MKKFSKTLLSIITAAAISLVSLCGSAFAVDSETVTDDRVPDTAVAVVKDMGNGINLGNTMEACGSWINGSSPTNYETAWGQPVTTQAMIDGMKEAGFNTVRIPVAWSNMMSDDGTYTIDEAYLDRVEEIVNYVLNAGMYAIVNDHWDGGWWEDFGSSDETVVEEAWKRYEAIWTQVGERFKDYSHKLILESANEELGSTFSMSTKKRYALVTEINQKFVDIIRSQGSNNSDRYLLIAGFDTNIDKTVDERYIMPTDTIENHLMISVHYYDPSTYCLVSDPDNSWGYSDTWGTDEEIEYMDNQLGKMKYYTEQGIGVVIGEFGAFHGENGLVKEGTYDYYDYVLKFSEKYNLCPVSWDCSEWYKRTLGYIADEEMAKVFKSNEYTGGNYIISGEISVTDENTEAEMTVVLTASDGTESTVTTTSAGNFYFYELDEGEYTVTISGGSYAPRSYNITVTNCDVIQDATLTLYGDVNCDGKVTTADVGLANSHAKGVSMLEGYALACADVNSDGEVTTADVGRINSHAKGVSLLW
ncbi:MAG: cellulase family glycosylhydrolase [Ruminococcus sp.]|nr:cellulase family glycosylhydrolase [Ruminococcus sp.]